MGPFTYCTLGDPIDLEGMLSGDSLPSYSALASYLLYTASGVSVEASDLTPHGEDGLFYRSATTDYHLLYEPDTAWLCSNEAMLNQERAKRISADSKGKGRKAVVFAAGKYIGQRELTAMGITFCQLPYEMHVIG